MLAARQVSLFWNYLPAFRVIAEHEHLHDAARVLAVSPSALSRTLRMLEASLGTRLFHRDGGTLRLTQEGQSLLESVRAAMRVVHDGAEALREQTEVLRIGVDPWASFYTSTIIEAVRASVGEVRVAFSLGDSKALVRLLSRGDVDLVLTFDASSGDRHVQLDRLADITLRLVATTIAAKGIVVPHTERCPYLPEALPLPVVVRTTTLEAALRTARANNLAVFAPIDAKLELASMGLVSIVDSRDVVATFMAARRWPVSDKGRTECRLKSVVDALQQGLGGAHC